MCGGPRGLSSAPRDVPSLSPGDDTATVRVALSARLLAQKSFFAPENRFARAVRIAFLYDNPGARGLLALPVLRGQSQRG